MTQGTVKTLIAAIGLLSSASVIAEQPSQMPELSKFDKGAELYNSSVVIDGYRFGCRVHDKDGKCSKLQWKKL